MPHIGEHFRVILDGSMALCEFARSRRWRSPTRSHAGHSVGRRGTGHREGFLASVLRPHSCPVLETSPFHEAGTEAVKRCVNGLRPTVVLLV